MKITPHQHPPRPAEPPDVALLERTAELLRALADPLRLKLVLTLARGEACVSELLDSQDAGLSTVSQRLKLLRQVGLVSRRREGKHIYYQLADTHVRELVDNALAHAAHSHSPSVPSPSIPLESSP